MTLREETAALEEKGRQTFDAGRKAIYQAQADALASSDLLERALGVGDKAPMFALPDAHGDTVKLAEVLVKGPAIVSFYRGSWCPYCNLELRALQRELASVDEAGATLVAISPNRPDVSSEFVDELGLTFPVLSDLDNAVAKQFNIVYQMEDELAEYYVDHDRDIAAMNGTEAWELPVPATLSLIHI